jgi:N-acetylmuramoyl-L-alanine amidase
MRSINKIIIHCSATIEGKDYTVEQIRSWHIRDNGWKDIGYHFVIYRDGSIHAGRPIEQIGAHCLGMNNHSIGICYIGGMDINRKPKDTRTPEQKTALISLVKLLKASFPDATVHGHNEFANKSCPCFDVQSSDLVNL